MPPWITILPGAEIAVIAMDLKNADAIATNSLRTSNGCLLTFGATAIPPICPSTSV